jgi:hypothetical protein
MRARTDAAGESVMIPEKILRFLEQRANAAFAGTRDRQLAPRGHRVSGWRVGGDERTMTALVPGQFTPHLVESLEDNGEFALTVEEFPSHETYQFKGRYLRSRPVQGEDAEVVNRIRERFVKSLKPVYADVPEAVLRAFILPVHLAVEFEVREIYLQTPGPGAGRRLVPPEA